MEAQQRKKASRCCRVQHVFQEKYDGIHRTPEKLQWKGAKLNWKWQGLPWFVNIFFTKLHLGATHPRARPEMSHWPKIHKTKGEVLSRRWGALDFSGEVFASRERSWNLSWNYVIWFYEKSLQWMESTIAWLFSTSVALAQAALLGPLLEAEGETLPSMFWGSAADSCHNCTIDSKPQNPQDTLIKYTWLWNIVKHCTVYIPNFISFLLISTFPELMLLPTASPPSRSVGPR